MSTWLKTSKRLKEIEKCIYENLSTTGARHLSVTAVFTLATLFDHDGQRATDLAHAVGYPQTAFTTMLDMLERGGFIDRRVNVDDRRSVLIYLTKEGKALQGVILAALANAEVKYGRE